VGWAAEIALFKDYIDRFPLLWNISFFAENLGTQVYIYGILRESLRNQSLGLILTLGGAYLKHLKW
jgi:hypothetical protein